ncbi:MAG: CCA tRNA nucleotidyltransferase [Desulfobacterales bacterium]
MIPPAPGAFLVGGTVRDMLLGRQPTDYDIAAPKPCESLARQIAENTGSRMIVLGKPYFSIYRIVSGKLTFDVAPLEGGSIYEDLKRRDFTLNAMAWDLTENRLIDIFNGKTDLKARLIRMVSEENLRDDPVRLLRAFRHAALLGFEIEAPTKAAISRHAGRIKHTAGERVREELIKLLSCPQSHSRLREMDETGLLTEIFDELQPLKTCTQNAHHAFDAFEHTMAAYFQLEKLLRSLDTMFEKASVLPTPLLHDPTRLKLAMLLHDIGKPRALTTDKGDAVHFYNHEALGADMLRPISRRLKLSNEWAAYLDFIIRNHLRPLHLFMAHQQQTLTCKGIARFFMKSRGPVVDLLVHAMADARGKKNEERLTESFERFCRDLVHAYVFDFAEKAKQPPLINGHDLIRELNLPPSPLFSKVLARVEEKRLVGRLHTRTEALEWIKNFIKRHNLT